MKQTRKRRILIVDDSKMNREILTGILEDEYDIVEAEDGKKAIEIMEEGLYSFSIVLLDITMPELDGFGVLQVMQQRNWLKGLPVIIMEPLRGGRLVNLLPESAKELFRRDEKHRTPAELALKWLYDQPEVTCVLSGMNSMEMVEQNVKTASESLVGCLTPSDRELIEKVKDEIKKNVKVGCTGCGYCMPCPKGVDIPGTFRCYNAM